ncbi:maltase A1-like [Episyrphus balteatus]|uniref:maltase A1-like n=1 Tax=Episyrphus balteatus TaxID=286459 RepID=UPI0024850E39|nr:maltase A1-like [Episyrphus balteatus]
MKAQLILLFITLVVGTATSVKDWWENGNFYQIYPRSFKDSDGDGIGDLNGVTEKLQYLKDIGITAAWLSPIFQSPMEDFGYDISDYYKIQEEYGTVDDFEKLLNKAKEIGIRIILDFVPNHTSDKHKWFQLSVAGHPYYRDFYIWENGTVNAETGERQPPNNWLGSFRYSAWEWNDQRQQYYLHQFGVMQPDLNYRNPAVVEEMKKVMRYWLGKGVSGFRIDAVPFLFEYIDENGKFPDEPVTTDPKCPDPDDYCHLQHIYTNNQPETFDMVYQWRELVDNWKKEHGGETKVLLTEAYTSFDNLMKLYGDGIRNGSHVPFNFEFLNTMNANSTAKDFRYQINRWLQTMPKGVYANWVLGNHDNKRLASRLGPARTDLLNILLQTLPGIAVTYNGEEIGMTDGPISWEDTVDPQGCNANPDNYNSYSRDPARTPFQWNSSKNAGFSSAPKTWLPTNDDYITKNVENQLSAPRSHLKIFAKALSLRHVPAFEEGDFKIKAPTNGILVYKREKTDSDCYVIVLNLGKQDKKINLDDFFNIGGGNVEVVTASIQSTLQDGEIVDSQDIIIEGSVGAIFKVIK